MITRAEARHIALENIVDSVALEIAENGTDWWKRHPATGEAFSLEDLTLLREETGKALDLLRARSQDRARQDRVERRALREKGMCGFISGKPPGETACILDLGHDDHVHEVEDGAWQIVGGDEFSRAAAYACARSDELHALMAIADRWVRRDGPVRPAAEVAHELFDLLSSVTYQAVRLARRYHFPAILTESLTDD